VATVRRVELSAGQGESLAGGAPGEGRSGPGREVAQLELITSPGGLEAVAYTRGDDQPEFWGAGAEKPSWVVAWAARCGMSDQGLPEDLVQARFEYLIRGDGTGLRPVAAEKAVGTMQEVHDEFRSGEL
jgi:hypothetical protein